MEKIWDNSLNFLINSNPQAFLDLLLPGARYLQQHRTKQGRSQRQMDAVLEVARHDEIFIYNPEVQSSQDTKMAERLLLYHVLVWDEFQRKEEYKEKDLAVRSSVLALFERAKIRLLHCYGRSQESHQDKKWKGYAFLTRLSRCGRSAVKCFWSWAI